MKAVLKGFDASMGPFFSVTLGGSQRNVGAAAVYVLIPPAAAPTSARSAAVK